MNDTTKFAEQCPSYGLAHDSPYLGDLPQGSSAYVEGTVPVRVLFQSASEALEQSEMFSTSHSDCTAPTSTTPLRGVGFVYINHSDAPPVRLVLDVSLEFPERPRVQLSVEPSPFTIFSYALWIPDCDDCVQPLRLVHDCLGDFVQLVVRDAALFVADSLHHFQQFLPPKLASQVEVVSPYSPQLPPVEVGLARLGVHRTRHMSDSQVYGKNRGVGGFDLNLTFHDEVKEVFAITSEQLGLTDFEVSGDLAVGLYGNPDPAATELDWDANPAAGKFSITALDSDEVFSYREWVFSFGFDALIEPPSLLFVRRVEFNAGVALQESLESFVLVVENLSFDSSQPYNFCLDDLLNFHRAHRSLFNHVRSSDFRGEVTESIHTPVLSTFSKKRLFWLSGAFFGTFGPWFLMGGLPKVFPLSSPP